MHLACVRDGLIIPEPYRCLMRPTWDAVTSSVTVALPTRTPNLERCIHDGEKDGSGECMTGVFVCLIC